MTAILIGNTYNMGLTIDESLNRGSNFTNIYYLQDILPLFLCFFISFIIKKYDPT